MISTGEKQLTKIYKNCYEFRKTIEKLIVKNNLTYSEKVYILSVALVFLKHYVNDRRFTTYREFAYYIILNYSIQYNDYKPLYDYSVNFGLYPIVRYIYDNNLLQEDDIGIEEILIDNAVETYKTKENYIETYSQYKTKKHLLKNEFTEVAYIAPTSFGKSHLVLDIIRENLSTNIKIAIIVPTKSLLLQTYKMIKEEKFNKRLIIHDDMYDNNYDSFIAIFTQERALRLLSKKDIYYDILFIDEAHNIFDKDYRAILLSRLIKKNKSRNINQRIVYLSPLIHEQNNLKLYAQTIDEEKIYLNLKEPELYEYRLDNNRYKYNRFVDDFYKIDESKDYFKYIKKFSKNKNFIYMLSPKKIEEFSYKFVAKLSDVDIGDCSEIKEVIKVLEANVHKDFYPIKFLKKGLLYIHGQMPDAIKEYLEYKFKEIDEIKYIVANKVILEGINLPIDNLFILNLHFLHGKEITNLIGRVNRLNMIFSNTDGDLNKLLPDIHFVNNEYGKTMTKKIRGLRSSIFKDIVENPTLDAFDFEKLDGKIDGARTDETKKKAEAEKNRLLKIKEHEEYLLLHSCNEFERLKKYCIEHGINTYSKSSKVTNRYKGNLDEVIKDFLERIRKIHVNFDNWNQKTIIEKIYFLFIDKMDIEEFELKRLEYESTRKFYIGHIARSHQNTLKENINLMYEIFQKRIKDNSKDNHYYMGRSYGGCAKRTKEYQGSKQRVYVDLSEKSNQALINLAIVKLKLEDNFVSFTLSRFVEMMLDYKLISEEEYNQFIYGTNEFDNIKLIRYGLSNYLVSRLKEDNQLKNIKFDDNSNVVTNQVFKKYIELLDDDFYRFQLKKYL